MSVSATERLPLPPNVYQVDAPAAPLTPPLSGSTTTSIAIVGGGIVGLVTAIHLAEAGVAVTVLEAQEPGWGASGNNGGQLNPGLKFDPAVIEETYGPDLGRRMVAFAYDTTNQTFDLIKRLKIECDAKQTGTLRAAKSSRAAGQVAATARQCMERGMPVELLDRAAVAERTGTGAYRLAYLDRRGGNLNPLSYSRGLASSALAAGAKVYGNTRVTKLSRNGRGWLLQTSGGQVRAEKILIATNGFTDDLWDGLRQTIIPVFSAIAATAPLPPEFAQRIMPSRASLYEAGRITVYYRVDAQNRLLMGGRGPMRSISRPDDISHLTEYAQSLWPSLRGFPWTHGWNSQLAVTKDHWPHVHEPSEDALIYLGCNGRGVALGTAVAGQLAHRLMRGAAAPLDLPIVKPKQIRFHGLWPLAVRSVVTHGKIMDRLGL